MTREQVHKRIYDMGILSSASQRLAVEDGIMDLSRREKWSAGSLRLALKDLEEEGTITKEKRYHIQKEFFPDYSW